MSEKKKQGFAALSPEFLRECARKGGIAAHAAGVAHRFTTDSARAASARAPHVVAARARREPQHEAPAPIVEEVLP